MSRRMNHLAGLAVRLLCTLSACLLFLQSPAVAQSFTASLFGTTTDASGAGVPNAALVATNTANNTKVEASSDASGKYALPGLPPGAYTLEASANGFKKFVQSGIELAVQQQAKVDVRLEVGGVSESVTIE